MNTSVPFLWVGVLAIVVLLVLTIVGGAIYLLVRAQQRANRRAPEMSAVASQMGWSYIPALDYRRLPHAEYFQLFTSRSLQRVGNLISGSANGVQVVVFDYSYALGIGHRHLKAETVLLLMSKNLALPRFRLGRSGMLATGLHFSGRPGFSDSYALFADDERAIRSLFNDAVLSYFESNPGRCIEAGGNQIFLYQDQVVLPSQSIATFVNEGLKIINLFEGPQYQAR